MTTLDFVKCALGMRSIHHQSHLLSTKQFLYKVFKTCNPSILGGEIFASSEPSAVIKQPVFSNNLLKKWWCAQHCDHASPVHWVINILLSFAPLILLHIFHVIIRLLIPNTVVVHLLYTASEITSIYTEILVQYHSKATDTVLLNWKGKSFYI